MKAISKCSLLFAVFFALLMLGGCASTAVDDVRSVTDAGTTHVKTEKVIGTDDDKDLGTNYTATFGKEYESFKAKLTFDDQCTPKEMTVAATGVGAFEGQKVAAAAVADIQARLSDMGVQLGDQAWGAMSEIFVKYLGLLEPATDVPLSPD